MNDELATVAKIEIILHKNGNVTLGGNIGNMSGALALLDHAKDCIKRYHGKLAAGERIVIPEYDVSVPRAKHYVMNAETARYSISGSNCQ